MNKYLRQCLKININSLSFNKFQAFSFSTPKTSNVSNLDLIKILRQETSIELLYNRFTTYPY